MPLPMVLEGLVQVLHDRVREHVAFLLEFVDLRGFFLEGVKMVQHVDKHIGRPRKVLEGQVEFSLRSGKGSARTKKGGEISTAL